MLFHLIPNFFPSFFRLDSSKRIRYLYIHTALLSRTRFIMIGRSIDHHHPRFCFPSPLLSSAHLIGFKPVSDPIIPSSSSSNTSPSSPLILQQILQRQKPQKPQKNAKIIWDKNTTSYSFPVVHSYPIPSHPIPSHS